MIALKKTPLGYVSAVVCAVFLALSQLFAIEVGQRLASELSALSSEMVVLVPCIFILIGLLDVWIPQDWIRTHVGEESGFRGALYIVLLAMFQGGPLYGAFPTAHLLWKKGCSIQNVFLYLGEFSSLKIPMLLFEVSFLGWRFALVRAAIALPIFVLIAEIMAAYARRVGSQPKQVDDCDPRTPGS